MKKFMLLGLIILGGISYGRDFEYNAKRDILNVYTYENEMINRPSNISWNTYTDLENSNLEKYREFHRSLEAMDRGEHSNR